MKRKVLVLSSTFPRWKDDTTPSFVFDLCKFLSAKNKMIALAPHYKGAQKHEIMDNVEIYRFKYFLENHQKVAYDGGIIPNVRKSFLAKLQLPLFFMKEYSAAKKLVKKYKPQILHAHWLIPQGIIAASLKKEFKIPFIMTVHGSDLFPLKNPIFRAMQKYVLKHCDMCTVNSYATYKEVVSRFPEAKEKLVIRSMGVDIKKFQKNAKRNNAYKKKKIVLFVGRLNEQKGIQYLIKAIPRVKDKFPNIRLLIIGEGNFRYEMEHLVDYLDIRDEVEFLGAMRHDDIIDYYKMADVFVLPSITSSIGTEGFGLVLLEAMSAKTPVIGTNSGGIPYIIKNGQNGLLVKEKDNKEIAEAIIKIMSSKKLSSKLAKRGFETATKHYSWEIVARKFNDFYREIT